MVDQRRLPAEEVYVTCRDYREVADAIRSMVIRGAPAIGVAAAMGIALGVKNSRAATLAELHADFEKIAETISQTRPTAVNLFWAGKRMRNIFEKSLARGGSKPERIAAARADLIEEAKRVLAEDIAGNQAIGRHGRAFVQNSANLLTHCNAGALATGGFGTALRGIRFAGAGREESARFLCGKTPLFPWGRPARSGLVP